MNLLIVCLAFLFPIAALGQNATGTILGTVTDAAGATVPAARITITNERTGQRRELITDPQGGWVANFLPVGFYGVAVEKQGFRRASFTGIQLQVDQQARLDSQLETGSINQEITIQAAAPLLQTENASLGDVIDTEQIVALPLNGRNFLQLATLTPGVNNGGTNGDGLSVNGGRGDFNGYVMDGVSNYSRFDGSVVVAPNVDAVQEFKVQTAIYSAEFGFAGNGQINLVTKSGTNVFHGTAYEFLRNRQLDARNFFEPAGPPAAFKRNQFGGTFGGPLRKSKTFFFGDYEGNRVRQSAQNLSLIPTRALRQGDFSGERPVFDVATFNPINGSVLQFPANRIPPPQLSKVAQGLNEFYPEPNIGGDSRLNYVNTASSKTDSNKWGVRVDHAFNGKHQLFGRYGINDSSSFSPGSLPVLGTFNVPRAQLATVNHTWLVSPRMINEVRLGYNRNRANQISARTSVDDVANRLGIGGVSKDPLDYGFPNVSLIPNYSGVSDPSNPFPTIRKDSVYQLNETMSITRGEHVFRFGAQIHRTELNGVQNSHGRGTFEFDGRFTRNPAVTTPTGNEFGDYILGFASRSQRQVGSTRVDMRSTLFGAFFQDDWKVSRKLTLNFGVRYEFNTPLADKYGRNANVDFVYGSGKAAVVLPGDTGPVTGRKFDNATYLGDYNNWAPRFGFAYRPFPGGNTVVRGGYGIFYALSLGQMFTFQAQNPPRIVNDVFTAIFPSPVLTFENAFQLGSLAPSGIVSVRAMEYARRDPYIQQWDFTVQHQVAGDLVFELAYVGTKGTKLPRSDVINSPRPGPGPIQPRRPFQGFATFFVREARMSSMYHALQFKADKRFSRHHQFLAAYTFSKSIDTGSSSFGGGGNSFDNAQDSDNLKAERGRSAQDARQVLTVSYVLELPFLQRNRILGGWQLSGIASFRTGLSQSAIVAQDRCNCDRASRMRADVVPGVSWTTGPQTPEQFFNTAAFRLPAEFTFGNSGRGVVDTPGRQNFDFSLQKYFPALFEGHRLQLRWELFNGMNHTNFGTPNMTVDNRNFGRITSASAARQMQFGLRYQF